MTVPSNTVQQTGVGAISADAVNTCVQVVLNYNAMRSFIPLDNMVCVALGTSTPNDGGQGHFYYVSTGTYTDNNTTTIVPYGAITGAWLRLTGI